MATNRNFIVKNGLEVDGDTLFVDPTNNRVGIKDSTPSFDLDVNGTGRFTGDVTFDSNVSLGDSDVLKFGDGEDLKIFHDGSNSYIADVGTGGLNIQGSTVTIEHTGGNHAIVADGNGSTIIYYQGAQKFATTSTGVSFTGNITLTGNQYFNDNTSAYFGTGNDLRIYHDGSNSYVADEGDGGLRLVGNQVAVRFNAENMAVFNTNADVKLYYDNVQKFQTTTLGTSTTGLSNADVFQSDGGTYAAASETATDAALVIPESSTIYTNDGGYLRALIGKNGDDITIGQHNTALITDIELKPGNNGGAVKLHHAGASDNLKLQTTGSGVSVTGTASATTLSTGAVGTGINISTNTISGPATLTIDPAGVGNNTGTLVIAGNLQVDGTTTTINSTTLNVDDLNLTLASGAANAAAANGAGITVDGASATLTYVSTKDNWKFNKDLVIGNDDNGGHASYVSSAALRVDGDAGVGLFVTGNAQNAEPVAVFYKNDEANNIPAVIISSDADSGSESILDVRGRQSQSTADLSATSNSADTIFDVRGDSNVYVTGDLYTGGRYSSSTKYRVLNTNDESSLNVDQVDGLHASSFLRSDASDTCTGNINFTNQIDITRYGNTHFQYSTNYDTYLTYGAAAGGVFFRTYNGSGYSTKVTLDKDGNFGIGVTPSYKLHVSGDAFVTNNINNGGFDFRLGNSNQTSRGNSGNSRALVKQTGAKLVVNYGGDFIGGTEVQSNLVVTGTGGISTTAGHVTANTGNGWLKIGPNNTSYAHIETDRSRFYFNKRIIVDEGVVSSYNEDLLLYANNSGTLGVRVTHNAATTLYYDDVAKIATTTGGVNVTGQTETDTLLSTNGIEITGSPGTIANATFANGYLRIGTSSLGWSIDNNEMVTFGSCIINSAAGSTLTYSNRPAFNGGTSGSSSPFTVDSTQVVTNLNADLLDGQQGSAYVRSNANNDSVTGTFRTSSAYIEAGKGSGSVALTINDGQGNANVTFNHLGGTPDVSGSSGRIECSVDSTTANMYFELGNSSTANTNRTLTNIMTLTTSAITAGSGISFSGNGSGLTNLNAANLTGTINDARIPDTITPATRVQTKEIRTSNGTEIVINAGESAGKISNQTGELVYVNAEGGLRVCTPSVSNWGSGYVEQRTNITGSGIFFHRNTTAMGEITTTDTTWLRINQNTAKNIYTPRYIRADGGFFVDGTSKGIDGNGSLIGPAFNLSVGSTSCKISGSNNQLLLYNDADETVIHRNDGSNYYILLSDTGPAASDTWNALRPLYINTGTGRLHSNNGQTFAGGLSTSSNLTLTGSSLINHHATNTVDKIRVWSSSSYTIGMVSGRTHGRLNDYAMTFTFNNESDRGFLWRDTSHGTSGGAMSLSTDGGLAVSRGINVGGGETDTGWSDHPLHVDNSWQTGQNNSYNTVLIDSDTSGTAAFSANRSLISMRVDTDNSKSNTTSVGGRRHSVYSIYATSDSSQYTHGTYGTYSFAKTTAAGSGIGTQTVMGMYGYAQAYASNGAVNAYGGHFLAYRGGGCSGGTVYGVLGRAQNTTNGSGKSGNAVGGYFECECDEDTIADAKAVFAHIDRDGGTITTGTLFYGSYAGTVGTKHGIRLVGSTSNSIDGTMYISDDLRVGTTSNFPGFGSNNVGGFHVEQTGTGTSLFCSRTDNTPMYCNRNNNGGILSFRRNGNEKGQVSITSTSVSYQTSSDYRLKTNVVPLVNSIDRIKQLNPVSFNWIEDNEPDEGFIAHEVKEVFPKAVSNEKDGVDENGDPLYQMMDYGSITPLLASALKEAIAKIEQLEARVAELESN